MWAGREMTSKHTKAAAASFLTLSLLTVLLNSSSHLPLRFAQYHWCTVSPNTCLCKTQTSEMDKRNKRCKNLLILFSKTRFLTLSMVFGWGKSVKKKMKKFEKNLKKVENFFLILIFGRKTRY